MKTFLTRKTILIAAIAVLIAITAIVSVNVFNSSGPVTGLANAVTRPVRNLVTQVARVFESIYASAYRYDDLLARHEKTLIELNELRRNNWEAIELAEDYDRLRALLGFRERHTGYEHEPAEIKDKGGSNWSSSFTINIGYANSSIVRGNGVVTEQGILIGQVSEVGAAVSTVVSVLDTTFSAGALIGDGGGVATMKGDFALMRSGLLMVDNFDDEMIILNGDTVMTSGSGSVFPAGLFVGEIVEVHRHATGVGRYATVKPLLDLDTITHVFVITDFDLAD